MPRIIGAEPRDPALLRTVPRRVDEKTLGTKLFNAPTMEPGYTKPDFFAEPPSDDELDKWVVRTDKATHTSPQESDLDTPEVNVTRGPTPLHSGGPPEHAVEGGPTR